MYEERESKGKIFFVRVVAICAVITAVSLATSLAYLIFQGIRKTRLDNILDSAYRFFSRLIRNFLDMDPYVAAWALPLLLGLVAVIGMLVYRKFQK